MRGASKRLEPGGQGAEDEVVARDKGGFTFKGQAGGIQAAQEAGGANAGKLNGVQMLTCRDIQDVAYSVDDSRITSLEEGGRHSLGEDPRQVLESTNA